MTITNVYPNRNVQEYLYGNRDPAETVIQRMNDYLDIELKQVLYLKRANVYLRINKISMG